MPDKRVQVMVTPILGPSGPSAQPLATLVTIEDTRILLDCGWTEGFPDAILSPLADIVGTLDAVLISSSSLECAGGIPYLYTKLGCTAPCYMTLPVHRLAPLTLLDALAGKLSEDSTFSSFSLEDVASAFTIKEFGGRAIQVRFGEDAEVKGVSLMAVNAGHTLGACVWRLQRSAETVVYAPTFNHRSEAHLSKAALASYFRAPSAFITLATPGIDFAQHGTGILSSGPAATPLPGLTGPGTGLLAGLTAAAASATAAASAAVAASLTAAPAGKETTNVNKEIGETCLMTLRAGGCVLVPTDTAGRSLEILLRLEAALSPDVLRGSPGAPPTEPREGYPIFLLSHVSSSVVEHAKTLLEFMNERLGKEFVESRNTPFSFEGREYSNDKAPVRVVQSVDPIIACTSAGRPCVVLTSFASLELGFARALAQLWLGNPKHAVVFTSKQGVPAGSLASQLLTTPPPSVVTYEHMLTVPLTGPELRKWRESQDEERRRVARAAAAARARAEERAELAETVVLPVSSSAVPVAPNVSAPSTAVPTTSGVTSLADVLMQGQDAGALYGRALAGIPAKYRIDADGFTLDEDLLADCEYVDEVAEAAMSREHSGPHSAQPSAAGAGDSMKTEDMKDEDDGERPPGDEDLHPVAGQAMGDLHGARAKRRRMRGDVGPEGALARAPASLRFAMYAQDFGGDARAVLTEYGWTLDSTHFPAPGLAGAAAGIGAGDGSGVAGSLLTGQGMAAVGTGSASTSALLALQKLLPTSQGSPTAPGVVGAAGPLASAVLASAVAATGLVRPGETVPTKRVKNLVSFRLAAKVVCIGLEGRVDGASLVHILEEVRPRTVVLLRGPTTAAQTALAHALRKVATQGVHAPALGLAVDISSGVAEVSLLIRDALWSSLHFSKLALPPMPGTGVGGTAAYSGALEVAFVHATVEEAAGPGSGPVLTLSAGNPPGHFPVLLRAGGAARLADVRKRLARAGIDCEVAGEGAIVTKGGILLTRTAAMGGSDGPTGEADMAGGGEVAGGAGIAQGPMFEIEGPACPEYFQVRKVLYDLFAFV